MQLGKTDLQRLAARVTDDTRRFKLREGLTPADDRLPKRFHTESLPGDHVITEAQIDTLV